MITIFATTILLIYMASYGQMAAVAAEATADLDAMRNASPRLHATLALLVATVLAVRKSSGVARYGWRKQEEQRQALLQSR